MTTEPMVARGGTGGRSMLWTGTVVLAILATERALGRPSLEMANNNPGFDIISETSDGQIITIEAKDRIAGAGDVIITKNEVLVGKNKSAQHRLALVEVNPETPAKDRLVYLVDPFIGTPDPGFNVTKLVFNWSRLWEVGGEPC